METLMPSIDHFLEHPDCGQWLHSLLLFRTTARWRQWPVEIAIATVDRNMQVASWSSFIKPPRKWQEDGKHPLPAGESVEEFAEMSLQAWKIMPVLNRVFQNTTVHSSYYYGLPTLLGNLEEVAEVRATWKLKGCFSDPGDDLRINLGSGAWISFSCPHVYNESIIENVHQWALGCVRLRRAFDICQSSLLQFDGRQ